MSNINEVKIEKLEYPYNIQRRQGMFGSSGENADILFRELVDNTVDLSLKFRTPVSVKSIINKSEWNAISDNGLGMPLYIDSDYPDKDQPILIDMMRKINVGSNFNRTEYSIGQNGVGSRLTQALSDEFVILVNAKKKDAKTLPKFIQTGLKDGHTVFYYHSRKGILVDYSMYHLDQIPTVLSESNPPKEVEEFILTLPEDFGTAVLFKPTAELLDTTRVYYHGYPFKLMKSLFQYDKDFEDIKIEFEMNGKEIEPFDFKSEWKEDKLLEDKVFTFVSSTKTEEKHPIKFICQIAYNQDKFNTDFDGSVNLLKTPTGKHINLVQQGIAHAFQKYNNLITGSDSKIGMRLFVLNFAVNGLWNSQDKTKLTKYEDKGYDEQKVVRDISDSFLKLMKENQEYFDLVCNRIIEYKKLSSKLSNIELLKSKIVMGDDSDKKRIMSGDMKKVYEATSNEWKKRDLYIVEGDSASTGLIMTRDNKFQSILPLRGKMANTSGYDEEQLVDNKEVLAIINTVGCGVGAICDPTKARYGKIIIATDSDSDGSHIANLVTALFYQHAPEVIRAGLLYKLETPFYKVVDGKKVQYFYNNEKDQVDFSKDVSKLKGLGSLTNEETKKFVMSRESRKLVQIKWNPEMEYEIQEAGKLMYSGVARRNLMLERGIFVEGNIL